MFSVTYIPPLNMTDTLTISPPLMWLDRNVGSMSDGLKFC